MSIVSDLETPTLSLHWHHNDHDGISIHQPQGCLLNRLFRCRWKKTSKLCVNGLCVGNSLGPVNSPHKGPVTRKMFPFDDIIMFKLHCDVLPTNTDITGYRYWIPRASSQYKDQLSRYVDFHYKNKATLRDLIAATGLVILLKIGFKSSIIGPCINW